MRSILTFVQESLRNAPRGAEDWRWLDVSVTECASLFSHYSNSIWFVFWHGRLLLHPPWRFSESAETSCCNQGSLQSKTASAAVLQGCNSATVSPQRSFIQSGDLIPAVSAMQRLFLKASPLCHGTANPASSLCGIPRFPDTSPFRPRPLPVSAARQAWLQLI